MTVSNEDQRFGGQLQRGPRRFLRQHVLPDGIARAGVEEIDPVHVAGGLEPLEEVARLASEDLCRPASSGCGLVVEVRQVKLSEHHEIVVPDEAEGRAELSHPPGQQQRGVERREEPFVRVQDDRVRPIPAGKARGALRQQECERKKEMAVSHVWRKAHEEGSVE